MRHGRRIIAWIAAAGAALASPLTEPPEAHAFPSSIGYGYGSCTACHFNPAGNGPLTDYGRALFATAFADKPFIEALGRDDDELTANSGFLGAAALPSWLGLSADFRGMALARGLESDARFNAFPMQADGSAVIRLFEDRLFFSGTIGYAPIPSNIPESRRAGISTWISREHYVGFRPIDWLGLYVGMMDPVFGLRIPEHTAFIRSQTGLDRNDQSHGAVLHLAFENLEILVDGMLGNLLQEASLRQRGYSTMLEWEPAEQLRLGASFLQTSNEYRLRRLVALHGRLGIGEGSSVLAQLGAEETLNAETGDGRGLFAFFQTSTRWSRGRNVLFTFEAQAPETGTTFRQFRAGPSLQWLPMQRLELRFDFLSTRTLDAPGVIAPDDYTLQSQLHLAL